MGPVWQDTLAGMARALRRLISAARTGAGLVRGAARSGVRSWRTAARKGGAGASGLTALTDLSLVNSAGDTLLAVALASTLFFAEP